jgi:hypothetical protein
METLFNKTIAKLAGRCKDVVGCSGSTNHSCTLNGHLLSNSFMSNWAYEEAQMGDWRKNLQLVRAAPMGSIIIEILDYNWSGSESVRTHATWVKNQAGAWEGGKVVDDLLEI